MTENNGDGEIVNLRPDELAGMKYIGGQTEWVCLMAAMKYIKEVIASRPVCVPYTEVTLTFQFPDNWEAHTVGDNLRKMVIGHMGDRK